MLTVKESLQRCNKDKLLDIYLERFSISMSDEEKAIEREKLSVWLERVLGLEPVFNKDTENFIITSSIVYEYSYDEDAPDTMDIYLDSFGSHIDELKSFKFNPSTFENIFAEDFDAATIADCNDFIKKNDTPESYSFEFSDWEEILAFKLSDVVVKEYGLEYILAGIIDEMTFFGYLPNKMEEEREELHRRAEEVEEIMKLPKEEQKERLVSWDKVKFELGIEDKRTEEQKQNDKLQSYRSWAKNRLIRIKLLYNVQKELLGQL